MPAMIRVLVYFMLMQLATVIAGAVPSVNELWFFFGVSFALTALFLKAEGRSLRSLGAYPLNGKYLRQLAAGAAAGMTLLVATAIITIRLTGAQWQVNTGTSVISLLLPLVGCLWSAYVQEFVFRGYPFQLLLTHYRHWIAQLAVAVPFGLMHVNSAMPLDVALLVMLTTGVGSVLFGLAYLATGNLMLPVGLHVGWNYAQWLLPRTPGEGGGIIVITHAHITASFFQIIVPYLVVLFFAIVYLHRRVGRQAAGRTHKLV